MWHGENEPLHAAVTDVLTSARELLVISPYVLAEVDYLVATRHGSAAELAVLDELTGGAWERTLDGHAFDIVPDIAIGSFGSRGRRGVRSNQNTGDHPWIHSVPTVNFSSTAWIGSTPIPGPVGTSICPSSSTNGSVMSWS